MEDTELCNHIKKAFTSIEEIKTFLSASKENTLRYSDLMNLKARMVFDFEKKVAEGDQSYAPLVIEQARFMLQMMLVLSFIHLLDDIMIKAMEMLNAGTVKGKGDAVMRAVEEVLGRKIFKAVTKEEYNHLGGCV